MFLFLCHRYNFLFLLKFSSLYIVLALNSFLSLCFLVSVFQETCFGLSSKHLTVGCSFLRKNEMCQAHGASVSMVGSPLVALVLGKCGRESDLFVRVPLPLGIFRPFLSGSMSASREPVSVHTPAK